MKIFSICVFLLLTHSTLASAEYSGSALQAIGLINTACAKNEKVSITSIDTTLSLVNPMNSQSLSTEKVHVNDIVEGLRDEHQHLVAGLSDPSKREVLTSKRLCIESHIDRMLTTMVDLSTTNKITTQ